MRRLKSVYLPKQSSKPLLSKLSLLSPSVESISLSDDEAFISQLLQILQPPETEWNIEQLRTLITSDSEPRPSPSRLFRVAQRLDSSSKALKLFDHLEANSKQPDGGSSESSLSSLLSATFQAVLEHALREPRREKRLFELYAVSKERNVTLTVNALTLLLDCFGRAGMRDELLAVFEGLDKASKNTDLCNKTLHILLMLRCFDEALQVLDEMLEPKSSLPPNEDTGRIVFTCLLSRERPKRWLDDAAIVELVSKFGYHRVFPYSMTLTQLVAKLCRDKKVDCAWKALNAVIDSGGPVLAPSCNVLLTGLSKIGDFKRMNELMAKMKIRDIKPSRVTFGILINSLCKSRRIDEALEMFAKMRENRDPGSDLIAPDVVTYNTLIDGLCKVGRQEKALILMEEMRSEQSPCKPNTVTYNSLIDGFNKVGETQKAMSLFEQMRLEGVDPSVVTLNTLIDGLCRAGKVNAALVLCEEMEEKGVKVNAFTYSILITAFCGVNNMVKAAELFERMRGTGCRGDAVVFSNMIFGLCRAGMMNDASLIAEKMKEAGFGLDIVTYNVLISGFCKTEKIEKAYLTVKEMEENGIEPDNVTYNTLIAYLSKNRELGAAQAVLHKMLENGHFPTVFTYGALIHGHCIDENIDEAMRIFRGMDSKSVPNTVIYNILVNALCKKSQTERAYALVEEMRVRGVKANATTYNSLFKSLRERNLLDKAFEVMDRMVEDSLNPDYITVEILTEWLPQVGEVDKLREFLKGNKVSNSVVV